MIRARDSFRADIDNENRFEVVMTWVAAVLNIICKHTYNRTYRKLLNTRYTDMCVRIATPVVRC